MVLGMTFLGDRLRLRSTLAGCGVIWNGDPLEPPVIPAKAGIQSDDTTFPEGCGVHSRFRGNDCGLQRPCLANDTSTRLQGGFT